MGFFGKVILATLLFVAVSTVLALALEYWYVLLLAVFLFFLPRIVREIRMRIYFASAEFRSHLDQISKLVAEHNELSTYITEIRQNRRFSIGRSLSGSGATFSTFENTSKLGYKRDRNTVDLSSEQVHHTSLQVVRNASLDPIRYLIKYFEISPTEEKLSEIEGLGESISRLENAVENLRDREGEISDQVAPPKFILKHFLREFQSKVGLSIPPLSVPYPVYKFQYVSAGGNSSQVAEVKLTSETLDALIETLSEKIKFRNSAAGQRALMTASFRERIKSRDDYACRHCGISIEREPHLLLEVDHIMPVSKGGLSVEDNLQTLCWKCNRSKAAKF